MMPHELEAASQDVQDTIHILENHRMRFKSQDEKCRMIQRALEQVLVQLAILHTELDRQGLPMHAEH